MVCLSFLVDAPEQKYLEEVSLICWESGKNPPDIGIEGACSTSLLKRDKNQHDIFINLEDPIQIAV